jgi:hypothetical protein
LLFPLNVICPAHIINLDLVTLKVVVVVVVVVAAMVVVEQYKL